jgi:tetratricopeptide (TPR) repeat protein
VPAATTARNQAVVSAAVKTAVPAPKGRKGWLIAIPVGLAIAAGAYALGRRSAAPVPPPEPIAQRPSTSAPEKSPTPTVAKQAPTEGPTPVVAKQVPPTEGPTSVVAKQPPANELTPAVAKQTEAAQPTVAKQGPAEGAQGTTKTDPEPAQPGADTPPPASEFDALMARAKAANQRTAYRTAAASYRKALALQPDSLEAKSGLGIALVNGEGSYVDAVRLLSEVVKARDQDERAWLALGMAYQFNGDQQSAFKAYRKYLELAPDGESAKDVKLLLQQPAQ